MKSKARQSGGNMVTGHEGALRGRPRTGGGGPPQEEEGCQADEGTQVPTPRASSGAGAEPMDTEEGARVQNPLHPLTVGRKQVKRHKSK